MENLLNQAEGLGETWMPRTLAAKASLSTMHPYSWLGKGESEPRGKWVPENSLGEGGYVGQGEGKENMEGNALLAVQMQCSFFSGDFRAFHCGHLKAEGWLGAKLQGFGCSHWALAGIFPKPHGRAHFGGVHSWARALGSLQGLALVSVEEASYALSWLHGRP